MQTQKVKFARQNYVRSKMKQRRLSNPASIAVVLCMTAGYTIVMRLLEHFHWFFVKDLLVLAVFVFNVVMLMWTWSRRGERLTARKAIAKRNIRYLENCHEPATADRQGLAFPEVSYNRVVFLSRIPTWFTRIFFYSSHPMASVYAVGNF